MYKDQLIEAINLIGVHPYYTKHFVTMQIEIYRIGNRITEEERLELLAMLEPQTIDESTETPEE